MASHFVSESLAEECVPESDITNGFMVEKLASGHEKVKRCLEEGMKIHSVTCKDITGTNGYCSKIYKYGVELAPGSGDSKDEPTRISVILKLFSYQRIRKVMEIFTAGELSQAKLDETVVKMSNIHNRECQFYSTFGKLGLVPLAECYYTQELDSEAHSNGILLLQDLTENAYLDRFEEGLNKHKVESVVKHLARLHTYILCRDDKEEWLKPFEAMIFDDGMLENEEGALMMGKMLDKAVELAPEVEPYIKRLKKSFLSRDFWNFTLRDCAKQYGVPTIFVHGDLWTNNILWRKSEDGKELDEPAALIDWQIAFTGNPMYDIARLVVMCCEVDVRRELDTYILQFYLDELSRLLQEEGAGKKPPFTLENLKPAYEVIAVHQAEMLTGIIPFFTEMWSHSDLSEEEKAKNEYKIGMLKKRLLDALKDAVKILERVAPEWLGDE